MKIIIKDGSFSKCKQKREKIARIKKIIFLEWQQKLIEIKKNGKVTWMSEILGLDILEVRNHKR